MAVDTGRGWHGDPQGHSKAGRKGGQTTARTHGADFYKKIGRKGGQARRQQNKAPKSWLMK